MQQCKVDGRLNDEFPAAHAALGKTIDGMSPKQPCLPDVVLAAAGVAILLRSAQKIEILVFVARRLAPGCGVAESWCFGNLQQTEQAPRPILGSVLLILNCRAVRHRGNRTTYADAFMC